MNKRFYSIVVAVALVAAVFGFRAGKSTSKKSISQRPELTLGALPEVKASPAKVRSIELAPVYVQASPAKQIKFKAPAKQRSCQDHDLTERHVHSTNTSYVKGGTVKICN